MVKKTIRVCDKCEVPLIWTFAFTYCERFCLNCGTTGGMIGTGTDVPITRELLFQERLVESIWKAIYGYKGKGLIPEGKFGRGGCKKDNKESKYCNDHRAHLTPAEKEYDQIARKYLAQFQGCIKREFQVNSGE